VPAGDAALMRLLQLSSSSLPVGGFTYSQGIEWAVEQGWIADEAGLQAWLLDLVETGLLHVDLPVLVRLYRACQADDGAGLAHWSAWLIANRETRELREEERNRGRAMTSLLRELEVPGATTWRATLETCQAAGFALAAATWQVPLVQALQGYAWAWLEGLVLAGVKLVPLGQSSGQRILARLAEPAAEAALAALALPDEAMGASAPAMAIASSRHETQYTRLFRS
jgi:urease accessory protein